MATTEKKSSSAGFEMDAVPIAEGGKNRKPEDMVDLYALPEKKFVKFRLFGSVYPYGGHWVKTKKKDGKEGSFYHPCAAFDLHTGKVDSTKACAFCDDESGLTRFVTDYFMNGIHRKEQSNEPENSRRTKVEAASGFKEKASDSWTPVKAIRLTSSVLRGLQDLRQLNTHTGPDGETMNYPVSHPKYGTDLSIKKDKSLPPAQMYAVQMGEHAPLKKSEREYLVWDLSDLMITPTEEVTASEHKKWATRMGLIHETKKSVEGSGEDDAPVVKKKSRAAELDDEDDDAPVVKKKKKAVVDEEDDDFADDTPPPKKKKAVVDEEDDDFVQSPKKKKAVVDEEDDDFADDTPPPKKKKAVVDEDEDDEPVVKKKKKAVVDEEDDDFADDEPPPKKKKAVVDEEDDDFAPPPKKKKAVVAEDDDDEPVVKKKKPAPVEDDDTPAPKKKKKPAADDDFDD